MTLTLHEALVPTWLQILRSGKTWLTKARESGQAEDALISARLIDDMLPFAYQVKSMGVHSRGAIEGVRAGLFSPDMTTPPDSFAGLDADLDRAITLLEALSPDELEDCAERDMRFEIKRFSRDFTVRDFLLSFSQPNFFFHAATAYGILRMKGVSLGKVDYLGAMRIKA